MLSCADDRCGATPSAALPTGEFATIQSIPSVRYGIEECMEGLLGSSNGQSTENQPVINESRGNNFICGFSLCLRPSMDRKTAS